MKGLVWHVGNWRIGVWQALDWWLESWRTLRELGFAEKEASSRRSSSWMRESLEVVTSQQHKSIRRLDLSLWYCPRGM